MAKLRLGTYLLPSGEVVLIRTLMHLYSQDNAFTWVFAEEGPYDALIMDGTPSTAAEADNAPAARVVLKLALGGDPAAHPALQRPLKAEKLQEWLKATGQELATQADAPVATPAPVPAPTVAVAAPTPAPTPAQTIQNSRLQALQETRFKLLGLPPKEVLQNDPALIRMSTLLTRRPLLASELADLSHQPLDLCLLFLQKLLSIKLVAPEGEMPAALQEPAPQPKPAPEPAPEAKPEPQAAQESSLTSKPKELINGIRKRLGI